MTKNSCKLNWRPPADDGGLPIKKYIVEFMDKETGKWEPLCETPGDVTNTHAKNLKEGHEYTFRVKAVNDEGESEPLVADKAIKAKNPFGGYRNSKMLRMSFWHVGLILLSSSTHHIEL